MEVTTVSDSSNSVNTQVNYHNQGYTPSRNKIMNQLINGVVNCIATI